MLLTTLGEYVLAGEDGVWQETLISALNSLGYKTQAARQALARSVNAGWLGTERHGRRSRVRLTPESEQMLRAGAERIYRFGQPWQWDGQWLLVILRVPEQHREVRHQLRTQLAWAGFGSLEADCGSRPTWSASQSWSPARRTLRSASCSPSGRSWARSASRAD